jgi:TrmH family RNA methyltransferase
MSTLVQQLTSLANPKVKHVVKLRQRSHRDEAGQMLVEGYRECKRALDNGYQPEMLFFCEELYLKNLNEPEIVRQCQERGAELYACSKPVFEKMAYRERPEGLLIVGPQCSRKLADLQLPEHALVVVAESIEKPGNLGTILRSADAAGVHAVIVCDRCTDIHNPNVVRASTGTLFSLPVVEAESDEAIAYLKERGFCILATTPHTEKLHSEVPLTGNVAIVVGTEQYGLTEKWMNAADFRVRIPMFGLADSLNVSAATTILLFEAVRQRIQAKQLVVKPAEAWHGEATFDE